MRISDWVQTCALPISRRLQPRRKPAGQRVQPLGDRQHLAQLRERDVVGGKARLPGLVDGVGQRVAVVVRQVVKGGVLHRVVAAGDALQLGEFVRSEEHTSELQSLMRISYAVFCLKKKKHHTTTSYKH